MIQGEQPAHKPGGATRDGGELSWACANNKHEGCRGVNCTCNHHLSEAGQAVQEEPYGYVEGYIDKQVLFALGAELHRSMPRQFDSAHEAWEFLWKGFEGVWVEVRQEWKKESERNPAAMMAALLHVAAMALKYANQVASEAREGKDGS